MATPPTGDRKVVAMLREAARSALAGGAPDTAALQLRRALDEPPDAADRPAVLFELGNAEHEIGDAAAPGHLQEAGETATDPRLRARAFMALAWTTHPDSRRQRQQLPLYEWAAREVRDHDRELALQLDAARLGALMLNPDLPTRFEDEADRFTELPALTAENACCARLSPAGRSKADRSPLRAISPKRPPPTPRWSARAATRCGARTSRSVWWKPSATRSPSTFCRGPCGTPNAKVHPNGLRAPSGCEGSPAIVGAIYAAPKRTAARPSTSSGRQRRTTSRRRASSSSWTRSPTRGAPTKARR